MCLDAAASGCWGRRIANGNQICSVLGSAVDNAPAAASCARQNATAPSATERAMGRGSLWERRRAAGRRDGHTNGGGRAATRARMDGDGTVPDAELFEYYKARVEAFDTDRAAFAAKVRDLAVRRFSALCAGSVRSAMGLDVSRCAQRLHSSRRFHMRRCTA